MTDLLDLLALPSIQRSLLAVVVAGLCLPIAGVFIVGLDVIPLRFAMMHVALLGIALGLWVGVDGQAAGLVLCAVVAAGLALVADQPPGPVMVMTAGALTLLTYLRR